MELACNDQVIRTSRLRYYTSRKDALDYLRKFQFLTHGTEPYVWRTIQLDSCGHYEIVEGKSAMLLDQSIGTKSFRIWRDWKALSMWILRPQKGFWKRLGFKRNVYLGNMSLSMGRQLMSLCIAF
ncbi:hypothetical protein CFP56_033889 [Quercus suber]|uniref:Uncharacterized protein n=1 Tax=Quercus suber TaxID=58331 RepID=A0AAW0JFK6_QUESU